MFDLRQWLSSTDVSGADDSLDEEAARLLILNDSLLDDESGVILASLIVYAERGHGLEVFEELARGSEPRFVAMALLNILYVLREERTGDCDFLYNPTGTGSPQGITIGRRDLPSEKFARARIASIMPQVSSVFLDKVSEGDFCPDFLTYLLTVLMDLSKDCEASPEVSSHLVRVQSMRFLKAAIRVWKSNEYSSHISAADNGDTDGLNLGFLVSCFLRCVCITALSSHEDTFSKHEGVGHEMSSEANGDICGVDALLALGDWFIKFVVMRIYQSFSNLTETEYLVSILSECTTRRASFGQRLVELQFGSTLVHCLKQYTEITQISQRSTSQLTCSRDVKSLWQYFYFLRELSEQLQFGDLSNKHNTEISPIDIWFRNFWDALSILSCRSVTLLIGTNFGSSNSGCLLRKSVSSVILQTNSLAWTVRTAHISDLSSRERRAWADAKYKDWILGVYASITSCCIAQGSSWDILSIEACAAAVRSSFEVCRSVLEQRHVSCFLAKRTDTDAKDRNCTERNRSDRLCEWCLEHSVNTKLCGTCQRVWYCSSEHQRMHWKAGHKTECSFVRNVLKECSINLEQDGRINGLISLKEQGRESCNNWTEDTELQYRAKAQRGELVSLGFRLPGVFMKIYNEGNGVEIRYIHRGELLSELKEVGHDSGADEVRRVLIACLKNCGNECRLEMIGTIASPSRQLRMHFRGYEESHSLMIGVQ